MKTKLPISILSVSPPVETVPSPPVETVFDQNRWAKLPWTAICDARLSTRDLRIFAALCAARQGQIVTVGVRWLVDSVHIRDAGVLKSLRHLEETGYLTIRSGGAGRRQSYLLRSSLFSSSDSPASDPPSQPATQTPSSSPDTPLPLVRCSLCRRQCKRVLKAGWCRSCNADKRIEKAVDRKLDERGVAVRRKEAS